MQKIARAIDEELPAGWGFILMAFPCSDVALEINRCNYVANCKREDAVKVIREWLSKQTPENFGTHEP